ncbi:MAG TPA: 16S rRNA (uracil(1498)-N(3))-methyltransferase [Pseudobdellovibrionaceae bacterium]|nr:16S rRNA (uracil(1498)-N(3))-methyltransferase [Pseudobdellovibrionaceae bacterium]
MRRYWIETSDKSGDLVHFRGDLHHHIFDVCRQELGSKFEVLTEEGKAYLVKVTQLDRKAALAEVIEERVIPALAKPWIRVVLSVPRYPVMDSVLEKLVELGVKSVHPVFSEFSFVRSAGTLSENKVQRWEKIIQSATQQSGRGEKMELHEARPLKTFLEGINRNEGFAGLFAYEGPSTLGIKEELTRMKSQGVPSEIWLFVGSEGGFSTQEVESFREVGLKPVTLGQQVLRVETACMALVSVLKYDFDLMR